MGRDQPGHWVVEEQQRTELRGGAPTERVRRSGDVRTAELPEAADRSVVPRAEEWVEVRARWRVHAVRARRAIADAAEVGGLDPWQVGLEPHSVVVLATAERRTREQDRTR